MVALNTAVVILNFNGFDFLNSFLPSVIKYSKNQADVIVIDNASTDQSCKFLSEQYSGQVQLITLDKNYGFAGGYNQGLKQIDHPYVLLLNSDVEVTEGYLHPLIHILESHQNIAAVQPKIRSYRSKDDFEHAGAAGGFIDFLGYPFCRGRIFDSAEKDTGQYNQSCEEVFWTTGACMLIRNTVFKDVGGFDSDFFAHMEEIDLCWRIHKQGYKMAYTAQSKVFHVGGGTLDIYSPFKLYLNFRNNLYLLLKNEKGLKLLWLLPVRLILDGVAALRFLLEGSFGFSWAVLKAHLSFYTSFFKMLKKRKHTKAHNLPTCVYTRSIVYDYFVKKIKRFSDLDAHSFSKTIV